MMDPIHPTGSDESLESAALRHRGNSVGSDENSPDEAVFPGGLELSTCSDEICRRHHHRQSVSSTVSITCSDRDEDDLAGQLDNFDGDIESSIALEPISPNMLVPLVDRCGEMADLLAHPANKSWTKLVQNTIGIDAYENKCLSLWTKTERSQMPDLEWLRRSKALLSKKGCGGICDGRIWNEFCGMVGWDAGAPLDEQEPHKGPSARSSRESLVSTSSGKMSSIAEQQEEEEELGEEHCQSSSGDIEESRDRNSSHA
jgi:hypothetical protein